MLWNTVGKQELPTLPDPNQVEGKTSKKGDSGFSRMAARGRKQKASLL
jgi:hypothetical protein